MKNDSKLCRTLLLLFIFLLVAVIPVLVLGYFDWAVTVVIGFVISFVYIILAYITIRYAFGKSAKIFYRYMIGGIAFRFTFFLLVLFIVYKKTQLPIVGFVLSFIVFYVIFQVFEAKMVINEIKNQKNK